jgi:hypothetical protein
MKKISNKLLTVLVFTYALLVVSSAWAVPPTEDWAARYNGPGSGNDTASALTIDAAGNVYVTGASVGSGGDSDYATVKYDGSGNELWVARYNGPGSGNDTASALAIDAAGNVYVTGASVGSGGDSDYATVKYDGNGNELWAARYNGPGSGIDTASALAIDAAGNVYVTGASVGLGGDSDYATVMYDGNGNELWVARYNGPGNGIDTASAPAVDGAGNVYVTGASVGSGGDSDYATVKYIGPYTLSLTTTGSGSGVVNGGGSYSSGVTASVSATADVGSTFSGWSGTNAAECATGSVTMNANKSCAANFTLNTYTLVLNTTGSGSGTVNGAGTYNFGATATVSAIADVGSTFSGWTGTNAAECATGSITMNTNKSCTANFTFNAYTLVLSTTGSGSGTVNGAGIYQIGATATVSATADVGSTFSGWTGTNAAECATGSVTMNADKSCAATFTLIQPPPSSTYSIGGALTGLTGTVVLTDNAADNLSLVANGGFTFAIALTSGATYDVTVATQPAGQTCAVSNGSGTVGSADVTNVSVTCADNIYSIGGTITGLTGTIELRNNDTDSVSRSINRGFKFPTALASGATYNVTVATQPKRQTCVVKNGQGTVASSDVTNILVTCSASPSSTAPAPSSSSAGYGGGETSPLMLGVLALSIVIRRTRLRRRGSVI